MRKLALIGLLLSVATTEAMASTCPVLPSPLSNGTTADATAVMADLNSILSCANSSLAPLANPHFTGSAVIQASTSYPLRIYSPDAPTSSALVLDTPSASEQAAMLFSATGAGKWQLGKHTDDRFFLYDATGVKNDILIYPNGNMSLMPTSGNVGIGTTTPTSALEVQAPAISSVREVVSTFSVSDAGNDTLFLGNGTSADTHFQPAVVGYVDSGPGFAGAQILALTNATQDTATNSIGIFDIFAARTDNATNPLGGAFTALLSKNLVSIRNSSTQLFTIAPNGNVGIGKTAPSYFLDVGSTSTVGIVARFTNSAGSCTINPNTTSLSCSSDARLKTDIEILDAATAGQKIDRLAPVLFKWRAQKIDTSSHAGFLAQDVLSVLPDLVTKDATGFYSVNYAGFVPYLTAGIQSLDRRTAVLEAENSQQKRDIASLQSEIRELRTLVMASQKNHQFARLSSAP